MEIWSSASSFPIFPTYLSFFQHLQSNSSSQNLLTSNIKCYVYFHTIWVAGSSILNYPKHPLWTLIISFIIYHFAQINKRLADASLLKLLLFCRTVQKFHYQILVRLYSNIKHYSLLQKRCTQKCLCCTWPLYNLCILHVPIKTNQDGITVKYIGKLGTAQCCKHNERRNCFKLNTRIRSFKSFKRVNDFSFQIIYTKLLFTVRKSSLYS